MIVKFTMMVILGTFVSASSHCNAHKPVCGANNVTYQNSCRCEQAQVEVAHAGECQQSSQKQPSALTQYTMRDSSQRTPSVNTVKYMLTAQHDGVPKGPFMAQTAGALKVTDEFTSGDWEWKHGVHQAMNTFKYDQKPAMNPFEWTNARTNSWDPVKENVSIYDSLGESEGSQNWDFIKEDEWAKKMEWTDDLSTIGFGSLAQEDSNGDSGALDVSQDVEVQSWFNGDEMKEGENVGASLVGASLY